MPSSNSEGIISSLIQLFKCCIAKKDLVLAEHGYSVYLSNRLHHHAQLGCLLIRLFSSYGSLSRSYQVFNEMHDQNVYAWTTIISAYVDHGHGDLALVLYQQMLLFYVNPSCHTFVVALKACVTSPFSLFEYGMLIHVDVIQQGVDGNRFVGSSLVGIYASYGSMRDASCVFDCLSAQDDVLWSVLIGGYAKHGYSLQAFEMVEEMHRQGMQPNKATIITLLSLCATSCLMLQGDNLHSHVVQRGLESDIRLSSTLIKMYAKCNRIHDAEKVFDEIPVSERDLVSWDTMIVSLTDYGCADEALRLLGKMKEEGVNPNEVTFVSLVKGCQHIEEVKFMHDDAIKLGLELSLHIRCSFVDLYVKCSSISDAHYVFAKHPQDVPLFSTMVKGYVDHGLIKEANELYIDMLMKDIKPDEYMYVCMLQACAKGATLCFGLLIHTDVVEQKLNTNPFVGNSIVEMYIKCGELECAQNMFDNLLVRDIVSFSLLISGYASCNHSSKAFQLFSKLWHDNKPDKVSYLSVVKACTNMAVFNDAILVYEAIVQEGLDMDTLLGSASINMFVRCGSLEDAYKIFEVMSMCNNTTTVAFSAMISGYVGNGDHELALHLFQKMQDENLWPDTITCICILKACSKLGALEHGRTLHVYMEKQGLDSDPLHGISLVHMYAKCGSLIDAHNVFHNSCPLDSTSWCTILSPSIHDHICSTDKVMEVIERMQEDEPTQPNEIIHLCFLVKVCSILTSSHKGLFIHAEIQKLGLESDPNIQNALIEMYAKCGNVDHAREIFEKLENRDVISWSIIVTCFAEHGLVDMVDQYLVTMQGMGILSDSPFVLCLLYACSHSGLTEEALHCFLSAIENNNIVPTIEHYICMIDMFGRLGCLDISEKVAVNMPFQPNPVAWVVLLSSCAKHNDNIAIAHGAYSYLMETEEGHSDDVVACVLMSNIYAACSNAK